MDILIYPSPLAGSIRVVDSKSEAHRALIAAALADSPTNLVMQDISEDIAATMNCLGQLGSCIELRAPGLWQVSPLWGYLSRQAALFCKDSASTLRFLLPLVSLLCSKASLSGSKQLEKRPLGPLKQALTEHEVQGLNGDAFPINVFGKLHAGNFSLSGNISSQYLSGLLFTLPLLNGDSHIELSTDLQSYGYINMTLAILKDFAVNVEPQPNGYYIRGGQSFRSPQSLTITGDWSNAAFWLVAGVLSDRLICCNGLNPTSLQPDRQIISIMQDFGVFIENDSSQRIITYAHQLCGATCMLSNTPDLVPILAVLACAAEGRTTIRGVERLKYKESDRLNSIAEGLNRLGGAVQRRADGLVIEGCGRLRGGSVDSFGDHRIAMALAIAAILCDQPVHIRNADAVKKSYPAFWDDYRYLGGNWNVL